MTRLLGIDFGTRRLGFAVAESELGAARPLETFRRTGVDGRDLDRVRHHVQAWEVDEVVVGVPHLLDGTATESTERAVRFAAWLQDALRPIPVTTADETLSSFEADQRMERDGIPPARRKMQRDGYAAAAFLDQLLADRRAAAATKEGTPR